MKRLILSALVVFATAASAAAQDIPLVCRDLATGQFVRCPADLPPAPEPDPPDLPKPTFPEPSPPPPSPAVEPAEAPAAPGLAPKPTPSPSPTPLPPPTVEVVAGTVVGLSADVKKELRPFGRVMVDWQVVGEQRPVFVYVQGEFTALPDTELDLNNAASFDSVEVRFGVTYKPIPSLSASGYCETGFASRFDNGLVQPVTSAPLWSSCGLYFRDVGRSGGRWKIGMGPDERLGYGWTFAAHASGSIRLFGVSDFAVTLIVDFVGGLEANETGQRVNITRAATGVSWGRRQ